MQESESDVNGNREEHDRAAQEATQNVKLLLYMP